MDKWEVRKVLMDVKKETIKKYFKFNRDTFTLSVQKLRRVQFPIYTKSADGWKDLVYHTEQKETWVEDWVYFFNCQLFDINYIENSDPYKNQLVLDFFSEADQPCTKQYINKGIICSSTQVIIDGVHSLKKERNLKFSLNGFNCTLYAQPGKRFNQELPDNIAYVSVKIPDAIMVGQDPLKPIYDVLNEMMKKAEEITTKRFKLVSRKFHFD